MNHHPTHIPEWIQPAAPDMPAPIVMYHTDGVTVLSVEYCDFRGRHHRTDGPAFIQWHANGLKYFEKWFMHGKLHRKDGPAHEQWTGANVKVYEKWCINGEKHRVDEPAETVWKEDGTFFKRIWFENGRMLPPKIDHADRGAYKLLTGIFHG